MENLSTQYKRQFTMKPPCEADYRNNRILIRSVKRLPFKLFGRFIVGIHAPQLKSCIIEIADQDTYTFLIPKEEIKNPAMGKAKLKIQGAELIINSVYPLDTIEDESKKETYHRKNIIEKRRGKR